MNVVVADVTRERMARSAKFILPAQPASAMVFELDRCSVEFIGRHDRPALLASAEGARGAEGGENLV